MTTAKKVKLIRVAGGVYRNEAGTLTVHNVPFSGDGYPWIVAFEDGIGCKVKKRFRTLFDCRAFINNLE